jgi:hypothetical protein
VLKVLSPFVSRAKATILITIWEKLPFELHLARLGEELYGEIPVVLEKENSQGVCKINELLIAQKKMNCIIRAFSS